jgi:hypothetical protein
MNNMADWLICNNDARLEQAKRKHCCINIICFLQLHAIC